MLRSRVTVAGVGIVVALVSSCSSAAENDSDTVRETARHPPRLVPSLDGWESRLGVVTGAFQSFVEVISAPGEKDATYRLDVHAGQTLSQGGIEEVYDQVVKALGLPAGSSC